jgi:hypothetical protein
MGSEQLSVALATHKIIAACVSSKHAIQSAYNELSGTVGVIMAREPAINLISHITPNDKKRFHFIDCSGSTTTHKQIAATPRPNALGDIEEEAIKLIKTADVLVIDSISQLATYNDNLLLLKFLQNLTSAVRINNRKMVLLLKREELEGSLQNITLMIDTIVDV